MRYMRWACAMLFTLSISPAIFLICCVKAVFGISAE